VYEAHKFIHKNSQIDCPILIFHSDKTSYKKNNDPEIFESDVVLNVKHIKKYGVRLGSHVTLIEIPKATHDVFLSKDDVQAVAFSHLKKWLVSIAPES